MPAEATLTLAAAPVLLLAAAEPVAVPVLVLVPPLLPVRVPWPAGMNTEPLVVPAFVPPSLRVVDASTLMVNEVTPLAPW